MQFQNGPGDQGEKIWRFFRTDSPWIVRVFPGTEDAVSDGAGENPERDAIWSLRMDRCKGEEIHDMQLMKLTSCLFVVA